MLKEIKFQSLFLLDQYFYNLINEDALIEKLSFNPYFYWINIFIISVTTAMQKIMQCFNPYFYWINIFIIDMTKLQQLLNLFQSLFLLDQYFYHTQETIKGLQEVCFNPYFYWINIFIHGNEYQLTTWNTIGFNPYFYWINIFIK